jgi:hypothetical protein
MSFHTNHYFHISLFLYFYDKQKKYVNIDLFLWVDREEYQWESKNVSDFNKQVHTLQFTFQKSSGINTAAL